MRACPRCGALNPQDHKFCGQCGQRLDTETAPESKESMPPWLADMGIEDESPEAAGDAPPWLAQLQDTPPSSGSAEPSAAAPVPSDLPAWLRDVESDVSPEPAIESPQAEAPPDDLPPWLAMDDTPTASDQTHTEEPAPSLEELPPWLNELSGTPPQGAAPLSTTQTGEIPPWLLDDEPPVEQDRAEPSVDESATTEALPAWLQESGEIDQDDASSASAPVDQADDVPAWLRSEAETESAPEQQIEMPAQPAPELPEWLLRSDDQPAAADESSPDLPVPDWSSELGEPIEAVTASDEELPEWLRGSQDVSVVETSQPASETAAVPAWLLEESPTAPVEPEVAPTPPASSAATEEIPAWLLDESVAETDQQAVVDSTPADENLPPWLLGESSEPEPSATLESAGPVVEAEEPRTTQMLPAWLLDESADDVATDTTAQAPSAISEDLPPWLAAESLDETGVTVEPAPAAQVESPEVPAWLIDDAPAVVETGTEAPGDSTESLPSWLAAEDESPGRDHPVPVDDTSGDLPSWLAEAGIEDDSTVVEQPRESFEQESEATVESGAVAQTDQAAADLPSWLVAADEPAVDASRMTGQTEDLPPWLTGIEDEPAQAGGDGGLPAWLDESEPTAPAHAAATDTHDLLGELELPAWLREESATPPPPTAVEPAPTWLQGIAAGAEESPTVTTSAAPTAAKPRIERTPERLESVRLLERLRDEPLPEPVVERRERQRSWIGPVLLILAVIAILAVVGVVLWGPRFGLNFGAAPTTPAAAQDVAAAIAGLPAGRPVVVAYEWDARRLGDLRPLEDAVLGAIEGRSDVPLVFLSTDPQGALLAEQRAGRLLGSGDPFRSSYGLGFANLGFKAGGPVALRRFADDAAFGDLFARDAYGNNLQQNDVVLQAICDEGGATACAWSNIGLLIVMADDLDDVRVWFEQLRSQHPALPTLLLTTEEVAPQAQPYAALPDVQMLSGLRAASALAQATGSADERIGRRADAVSAGGALWGLLALVGAGPAYVVGRRARRDAEDDLWR